jgi:hypothetical protein
METYHSQKNGWFMIYCFTHSNAKQLSAMGAELDKLGFGDAPST